MKKILALTLSLAMIAGLATGCGGTAAPATTPAATGGQPQAQATEPGAPSYELDALYQTLPFPEVFPLEDGEIQVGGKADKITLGFVQTALNHPWRIAMNESLQAQCERFPNVELVILDGEADAAKQANCIDDLLSMGVDAILLSPMDSVSFDNACTKVMDAGIPLIVLDRDVNNADKTAYIGQSNYAIGYALGVQMAKDLDGKGSVVELAGNVGNAVTIDRSQGFYDAIAAYPDIELLASGDAEFLREPASKLMDDYLTAYDEIDAVYSHAEESAWGAQLSIERAGRTGDDIKQYTVDASNEGFRSVESGAFAGDGNYTPYIGQVGVRAALYALMGKDLTGVETYEFGTRYTLPEMPIVTPANVQDWLGSGWGE